MLNIKRLLVKDQIRDSSYKKGAKLLRASLKKVCDESKDEMLVGDMIEEYIFAAFEYARKTKRVNYLQMSQKENEDEQYQNSDSIQEVRLHSPKESEKKRLQEKDKFGQNPQQEQIKYDISTVMEESNEDDNEDSPVNRKSAKTGNSSELLKNLRESGDQMLKSEKGSVTSEPLVPSQASSPIVDNKKRNAEVQSENNEPKEAESPICSKVPSEAQGHSKFIPLPSRSFNNPGSAKFSLSRTPEKRSGWASQSYRLQPRIKNSQTGKVASDDSELIKIESLDDASMEKKRRRSSKGQSKSYRESTTHTTLLENNDGFKIFGKWNIKFSNLIKKSQHQLGSRTKKSSVNAASKQHSSKKSVSRGSSDRKPERNEHIADGNFYFSLKFDISKPHSLNLRHGSVPINSLPTSSTRVVQDQAKDSRRNSVNSSRRRTSRSGSKDRDRLAVLGGVSGQRKSVGMAIPAMIKNVKQLREISRDRGNSFETIEADRSSRGHNDKMHINLSMEKHHRKKQISSTTPKSQPHGMNGLKSLQEKLLKSFMQNK